MTGQPSSQVVPSANEKLPEIKPVEQQVHGDAPGGQPPLEAVDHFRADLDRGPNPAIQLGDKSNLTVKAAEFTTPSGEVVKGSTYSQGRTQYFMSESGDKYRMVQQKSGETTFQPVSGQANRHPLAELPPQRNQTTGDQPAAVTTPRKTTGEPVADAPVVPPGHRRTTTEGDNTGNEPGRKAPVDRTQQIANATGNIDNQFTQQERNALRGVMDRNEYADASRRIAKLPEGQQDAAWRDVQAGVKKNLDAGVQPGTTGLLDRQSLDRRIANPDNPVAPIKSADKPDRNVVADAVKPVQPAVQPEQKLGTEQRPVRERGDQVVQPGGQTQLTEQQQRVLQRYQDVAQTGNREATEAAYRKLERSFGPENANVIKDRLQSGQPVNPTELPTRNRGEFNPPGKDNAGAPVIPKDVKVFQPPDGGDHGDRGNRGSLNQDQIARALEARQQWQDHGRDGKEGPGKSPGEGREIKLAGDQSLRGQIDMKQVQDLMRQPKDQPFPPGLENKLKNNPEALAALQQSWKEARDRDGKQGDLTMRGRQEGSDQSHALEASKGGQNQKGIPGFDLNDKATRDFLADAMKRLEQTKGQRSDDIFKGLDPAKADRLTKFLTEGSTDGKFNPARVKDFMGMADQLKNPTERLYDFLKGNKDLINNQQLSAKDTQKLLGDLSKILGDVNKQLGLDGGKNALRMEDILGRKLDPTRPGERLAAMQENGINRQMNERTDAMALTARMTPAQEMAIRQMLDLRAGKDPVAQPVAKTAGQEGQQSAKETGPGARFEGPQSRLDGAQNAANRADLGRPDMPVKGEAKPDGKQDATGKPEGPQIQRQQDIALGTNKQPLDAKTDKVDATSTTDRKDEKYLEEKAKRDKKEEEEKHEKEEQHKREEKARLDALMLAALAEKKRKQMEQEQKEKEKSDEKDKQRDREKRRRYIVREKDTLNSIATAQLRDVKLSPLIYEINKEVIQLRVENGKQVPDLKPKMIIWLPSTTEIEEFRKGGIAGARESGTQDKKMSADDELVARFGAGWSGGAKAGPPGGPTTGQPSSGGVPTTSIPGSQPATSAEVTAALAASAMAAAQKKRENIESLLGPIGRAKPADGRIKYIARLGDSLKSVAMKHPAMQDVNLWKLLAEINGMSVETDGRGTPVATLSRGVEIFIPSNVDVENFRARNSAPQAVLTAGGVKTGGVITEVATKLCEGCGRMTVNSATICPACGEAFGGSKNVDEGAQESAHDTSTRHSSPDDGDQSEVMEAEEVSAEDAKTVFVAPHETDDNAPTRITSGNHSMNQLNDECRMLMCDGLGIVCQLEVFRANAWEPVVSYEIYDDVAMRNEHTQDGRKRTVRIDLPPAAARELAHNDLNSNWKQYCSRALGHQID